MLNIPEISKDNDVFIYGFGIAGKWLSANLLANVRGFIDTDSKKKGRTFRGLEVYSLEDAQYVTSSSAKIIVTVVDIQDVIPLIKNIPHEKWIALGAYLHNTAVINYPLEESVEFVEYSLTAVEECHKGFLAKDTLFLRSIDLVITEKCSLKCKDCSNLMQYYEAPIDISFDEIVRDFTELTNSVDMIYEVRLIGGEPFMNKDIYRVIEFLVASPKIKKLVVYSNATIPIKADYADLLRDPKILFSLTNYGNLSKNTSRVIDSLEAIHVAYRLHPPENWTDSGVIHDFQRSVPQQEELFNECCGKNLLTVTDGKLFRCPFAANADRLKAIPDDVQNSVKVSATSSDIRRYISEISYLPACNFCKGRSFGAPEIEPAIQVSAPIKFMKFDR
jgi:hypothetical protein